MEPAENTGAPQSQDRRALLQRAYDKTYRDRHRDEIKSRKQVRFGLTHQAPMSLEEARKKRTEALEMGICLECGAACKQLFVHIKKYGFDSASYLKKWNYPADALVVRRRQLQRLWKNEHSNQVRAAGKR